MCFHRSQKDKKTKKRREEKCVIDFCLCTADITDPQKEGKDIRTAAVLTGQRRKHSVLPYCSVCSPLNYWHKTTSPCTFIVLFLFVLGTRANRRLFKTELFLISVEQYLSFSMCVHECAHVKRMCANVRMLFLFCFFCVDRELYVRPFGRRKTFECINN